MKSDREWLTLVDAPLVGFGKTIVIPVGSITSPVTFDTYPQQSTRNATFLVVDCSSAYNAIIGSLMLNAWKAVTSTYHLLLKFPTEYRIGEARGDHVAAWECYVALLKMDKQVTTMNIEERWVNVEPTEELETIPLDEEHPDRVTHIGTQASPSVRDRLICFLRNSLDIFTWSHEDMPGIDPSIMVHQLNVSPSFLPVCQRKRVFAQERDNAIVEEVRKLLNAGFIREVYDPKWLANVVIVKKANGK